MSSLKVLIWNVQDLFIFIDKYHDENLEQISEAKWQLLSSSLKNNKEIHKVKEISSLIQKLDFDLCLLTEVGGRESLENLNKHFLNSKYDVIHFPTNSDRGIDLGMLAKKDFYQESKAEFHCDKVFARGVLQYEIKLKSGDSFRFFLTHLKSKLSKENDFEGRSQRKSEVERLCAIYEEKIKLEDMPTFICGDFNGIISGKETEPELTVFKNKHDLYDVLELLQRSSFDSGTYTYFDKHQNINLMQLDYALCDEKWKKLLTNSTEVLNFDGGPRSGIETSRKQRALAPSDHYPIFLNIKTN